MSDARATIVVTVVRAEDTTPIEGALVRLWLGESSDNSIAQRTGADGHATFEFDVPERGFVNFAVAARGRLSNTGCPTQRIVVARESRIGFSVPLDTAITIRGRIVDEAGNPIAGVLIGVGWMDEDGRTSGDLRPGHCAELGPTTSDSHGRYERLESVHGFRSDSPAVLLATHRDFVPMVVVAPERRPMQSDGSAIVDLSMRRGIELAGRVVDEAGDPIPGATVTIWPQLRVQHWCDTRSTIADESGQFVIGGIIGVPVQLDAFAEGFVKTRFHLDGAGLGRLPITLALRRGSVVEGTARDERGPCPNQPVFLDCAEVRTSARTDAFGRFRLVGAPAAGIATIVWSGRCELRVPLPAPHIELRAAARAPFRVVAVRQEDGSPLSVPQNSFSRQYAFWHVAGSSGMVHLDPEGRGDLRLVPGEVDLTIDVSGSCATAIRFELPPGGLADPVRVRVPRGLLIDGVVTDIGGAPLAGAIVTYLGNHNHYDVRTEFTDVDGRYRISGARADGFLVITKRDFAPVGVPVADTIDIGGGDRRFDTRLHCGVTYHGTVRHADRRLAVGVVVDPLPAAPAERFGAPLAPAPVDANGEYRLEHMPSIPLRLVVDDVERSVEGRDGETIRVDFVIP